MDDVSVKRHGKGICIRVPSCQLTLEGRPMLACRTDGFYVRLNAPQPRCLLPWEAA